MRRFLLRVSLFVAIPLVLLLVLYVVTDPFKTLKPFSLEYFDQTNRDYLSSELFLKNNPEQHYDSFVFGSSRGCGLNMYHWKKYLPEGSNPYLFQAWGETLTGIEQKISFIDKNGVALDNAIILIDIPGSFDDDQTPTDALSIKDPTISGQPRWLFHGILVLDFLQKPSQWLRAIKTYYVDSPPEICFDVVTNDWYKDNSRLDISIPPPKDSLKNMSQISRTAFIKEISNKSDKDLVVSKPLINSAFLDQLYRIRSVFDKHGTNYRIVITPGFCYTNPAIAPQDDAVLRRVFGDKNVFDYSGKNWLSSDYNNYSDSGHFGLFVGWHIIEDIYRSK